MVSSVYCLMVLLHVQYAIGQDRPPPLPPKGAQKFKTITSAIRLRFNEEAFFHLSRIVDTLYNFYVTRTLVAPQQQCFPEGCVQMFDFVIAAHRRPTVVSLTPNPPNLFVLRISDFDLHIQGSLSGQLQIVPPIPLIIPASGTIHVSARQVSVGGVMDIQKTIADIPYIRLISCSLESAIIDARVENMGMITEAINLKYQAEIKEKARAVLEETLCTNVHRIIDTEFNSRLAEMPNRLSAKKLLEILVNMAPDAKMSNANERRNVPRIRRALPKNSNTLISGSRDVRRIFSPSTTLYQTVHDGVSTRNFNKSRVPSASSSLGRSIPPVLLIEESIDSKPTIVSKTSRTGNRSSNGVVKRQFFDFDSIAPLVISLSVLDTSATYGKFFIGVDGNVYAPNITNVDNYLRPKILKYTTQSDGRMIDMLISQYTINTLLARAYSLGAVVFHVSSSTPLFGKLLRTTCSMDEVCLSDTVSEPGEKYPNRQLEVLLRATKEPIVELRLGSAAIFLRGTAYFYVEGTKKNVGVIPFEAVADLKVSTVNGSLIGVLSIPKFEFKKEVNFFGLTVDYLDGLKRATRNTLLNMVNSKLRKGIPITPKSESGISVPSLSIIDGALMLNADLDIQQHFFATHFARDIARNPQTPVFFQYAES
ncbi:hypothetical protein AB6A40_001000 [Gnathostoma spinigerum]|uniref:Lipid-binding serum glycoprotein C-terminal domain-containing protein n=1 Tax=Gnathostoma spinigerum TaxID=75299 RepID=A0ABD6EA47_9BILA